MCEFRLFALRCFALPLPDFALYANCQSKAVSLQARPGPMLISLCCCPPVLCTSAWPKVMAPLYDADAAAEASAWATLSLEHIEKSISQSVSQSVEQRAALPFWSSRRNRFRIDLQQAQLNANARRLVNTLRGECI